MTKRIEKSIVVNVPLDLAYEEWTHFERFPQFMEGVKEVNKLDDRHVHWVAEIGGKKREWNAEIVAKEENEVVSWRSTSGAPNQGTVRFRAVSPHESEVHLTVEYEPEGAAETVASWFGGVSARIEGDLDRFKEHVESRASPGTERYDLYGGVGEPRRMTDIEEERRTGEMTGGALPEARARGDSIRERSSIGAERTQPMRYHEAMPEREQGVEAQRRESMRHGRDVPERHRNGDRRERERY